MSIFLYFLFCLVTMATNAKNKPPGITDTKTLLSPRHYKETAETFGISPTYSFLRNELKAFLSG